MNRPVIKNIEFAHIVIKRKSEGKNYRGKKRPKA